MAVANRLRGRYAQASAGGAIANLFDWELTIEADYEDVTAHGDEWEQVVPLKQRWTFRARGYITTAGTTYLAAFNTAGAPAAVSIIAYTDNGTTARFTAQGYPTRGSITAPMTMVEQSFEFRGAGAPTVLG